MKHHYRDITKRIPEPPKWWDENGVPRWSEWTPDDCADIYAQQAVLAEIRCQECHTVFRVCLSWSGLFSKRGALYEAVAHNILHYGDPPNAGCCEAGPTMSSELIRVIEFWECIINSDMKWSRVDLDALRQETDEMEKRQLKTT